ncbi:hypothetical protein ACES2J_08220 [Bdellovibrio bacteriovorus]|uniref:hypothetical protein n=1 Tax=Bdellovibrio bacteriovorus TaxID=959 RepID=UPI0035A7250A
MKLFKRELSKDEVSLRAGTVLSDRSFDYIQREGIVKLLSRSVDIDDFSIESKTRDLFSAVKSFSVVADYGTRAPFRQKMIDVARELSTLVTAHINQRRARNFNWLNLAISVALAIGGLVLTNRNEKAVEKIESRIEALENQGNPGSVPNKPSSPSQ